MIIENPEALKAWLTIVLEPKCDADPNALAKYVIALVKKDKPLNELKDTCTDQLDVFLQQETKPFVELLFKTLESKSYLIKSDPVPVVNTPVKPPEPAPPIVNNVSASPVSSVPSLVPSVGTMPPAMPVPSVANNNNTNSNNLEAKDIREPPRRIGRLDGQIDIDDREKRGGRRMSMSRSRSRSRSRSSRSRSRNRSRSRSRERDDRRRRYNDDKRDRRGPPRRYDRYPDYRRDGERNRDREREVDRNRDHDRPRSRSRTPRSRTRSRSRSRDKDRQRPELRDANHKTQSPSAAEHGDTDYRYSSQGSAPSDSSPASAPSSLPPVPGTVVNDVPPMYSFNRNKSTRRCRDFDEMGFCMRGDLCQFDHGNDPVIVEDVNLPGIMNFAPPPSQGPSTNPPLPPILVPPMNRPPLPPGPPPGPPHPPVSRNHGNSARPDSMPYYPEPYIPEPYNPEAPSLDRPPRIRPPYWGPRPNMMRGMGLRPPPPFQQHMTRELINVQTVDDTSQLDMSQGLTNRTVVAPLKRSVDGLVKEENDGGNAKLQEEVARNDGSNKRLRQFDFNRLGPRKNQSDNMTLELRKIPRGLNSITQLNNHFAKFGKIVNMQVCYEGNPEAALITFSSHAEANAAYRSTEAVLNNRFIKLFWHNKENAGGNAPTTGSGAAGAGGATDLSCVKQVLSGSSNPKKTAVRERLGVPVIKAEIKSEGSNSTPSGEELEKTSVVLSPTGNLSKTVLFNPAALKKNNVPIVSKTQQVAAAQEAVKKKQDEQRKEVLKITANIQKRKQELVEKYIQDQKLLIEKLEKNKSMPAPDREKVLKTINSIQESIKSVKKEAVAPPTGPTLPSQPKTKIEAQKELLDIEMDLYNKQHQGADTTELRKKVAELKQEARALGLLDSARGRGRGRGRGSAGVGRGATFRGRGRGSVIPSTVSVDHRPRKLLISGLEGTDKEDVMTYLSQFGEIENVEHNEVGHTLILNFKTRKEAELFVQAVLQGPKFKKKNLQMTWYKDASQDPTLEGTDGDVAVLEEELVEDVENVELVLVDDDEEEDSEARSWKR